MIKRTICLLLAALALTGPGAPALAEGTPEPVCAVLAAADTKTSLPAPKLKGVSLTASGVKVTWGAVKGAAQYRVFYRTTGGWKKAGTTAKTSYTVTGLRSGTKYAFTVRCLNKSGKKYTSGYDKTGRSITYIAAPKLGKAEDTTDGIKLTWDAVKGAAKYRVFYKTTGSWKKLADTTKTSYTWTKAKAGRKYAFTVRCLDKSGKKYVSSYDGKGVSATYIVPPTVKAANQPTGMKVTWKKVAGASEYKVYFKAKGSGGWNYLGKTTASSYLWNDAVLGMSYAFTVRGVGGGSTSAYKSSGYVKYKPVTAASSTDP